MPNKKELFFKACSFLPIGPLLAFNKKNSLFIPIYHAITNERLLHLEHILPYGSKNSKQFEQDLDHLLKHLIPISYEELLKYKQEGLPVPPNRFIITFDDGLRQTYELATEILLRKGVPAIYYLNSGVIDNKELLHRYKASVLIEHIKVENSAALNQLVMDVLAAHQIVAENYYKGIKLLNYNKRDVLDVLASKLSYSFEDYLMVHKPYMSSEQVQDLYQKGFVLGSHSAMHPEYWNINTSEQVKQTIEAMNFLQSNFGEHRKTFSFPFTDIRTPKSFFEALNAQEPFELLFGSQKLKTDVIENMIHRFDGDNNLSDMTSYLKALLVFQSINKIKNNTIVNRAAN